jgi:hypothetical protein
MRLPRVRFTVRRLMVAVAVVGVMLGAWGWLERRRARFEERMQFWYHQVEHPAYSDPKWHGSVTLSPRDKLRARLAEKYRRAARYPFLPVAPDPPEPE